MIWIWPMRQLSWQVTKLCGSFFMDDSIWWMMEFHGWWHFILLKSFSQLVHDSVNIWHASYFCYRKMDGGSCLVVNSSSCVLEDDGSLPANERLLESTQCLVRCMHCAEFLHCRWKRYKSKVNVNNQVSTTLHRRRQSDLFCWGFA